MANIGDPFAIERELSAIIALLLGKHEDEMAKDAVLFRWDREGHANVGWMNANIAHKSAIDAPFGLLFAVSFANVAEMKRQRRPIHAIVAEARSALSMSQREFGEAVGSSHRSAVRWDAGQASPGEHHLHTLAKLLHPVDRSLAAEVADAADETLEGLGLETPLVPAPPPPAAPPLPPPPQARAEDLVDLLVLTAVEQTGSAPAVVRPWLYAVMKRGAELRLTMDIAAQALRPAPAEATSKESKAKK